jgi:hypothetical protein
MDMTVFPNNRVIGRIYKYSKTTKIGSYQFATNAEGSVPLKVEASDVHLLVQECSCPGIDGDLSRKTYILHSKVKILWEIVEGEGSFVKVSRGSGSRTEFGEEVLYSPPHIDRAEPEFTSPEVKKVRIKVTAYHDDPTKPPEHDYITSFIRMEIHRRITKPPKGQKGKPIDEYVYDYWVDEAALLTGPVVKDALGDCVPEHEWLPGSPI